MPSRKKSKNKARKSKRSAPRKKAARRSTSSQRAPQKSAKKKAAKKKSTKKVAAKKKVSSRTRPRQRSKSTSAEREFQQDVRSRNLTNSRSTRSQRMEDFAGLSGAEDVDSESVDELVEEGNAFEAGAVAGVEEADSQDEREVHTHEVLEDDVPEEYDNQD